MGYHVEWLRKTGRDRLHSPIPLTIFGLGAIFGVLAWVALQLIKEHDWLAIIPILFCGVFYLLLKERFRDLQRDAGEYAWGLSEAIVRDWEAYHEREEPPDWQRAFDEFVLGYSNAPN